MDTLKLFTALSADFGEDIALSVVQVYTINMVTKVKNSDLTTGERTHRITKKAMKLLCDKPDATIKLVFELWELINDWSIKQDMHGLGGCEKKTFKELIDAKNSK